MIFASAFTDASRLSLILRTLHAVITRHEYVHLSTWFVAYRCAITETVMEGITKTWVPTTQQCHRSDQKQSHKQQSGCSYLRRHNHHKQSPTSLIQAPELPHHQVTATSPITTPTKHSQTQPFPNHNSHGLVYIPLHPHVLTSSSLLTSHGLLAHLPRPRRVHFRMLELLAWHL
jgi:hypothetical protein